MDMITILRADYLALCADKEMLEDIQAYDAATIETRDCLPQNLMKRLLNSPNPLVVFREWRGFNQSSLARTSGVNRVQIADIEAGRKKGSVDTLRKLANTLEISLDDLVP